MKKLVLAVMAVVLTACSTVTPLPNYRALAKKVVPANVSLVGNFTHPWTGETRSDATYCSGVAVTTTHILTAGHCTEVEQVDGLVETQWDGKVKIKYHGKTYFAKIVKSVLVEGGDDKKDAALLVLDTPVLKPVVFGDSDTVQQGDQVAVVGNTLGELEDSFTVGIVAYANRKVVGHTWIQSTANAAGGNSGGGTYDMDGKLVGILTHGVDGIASLSQPINKVIRDLGLIITQ